MYWYREATALSLLPWLAAIAAIWLGGWLLATHAFRLDRRERIIIGFALGIVLYSWLTNLAAQFLPPQISFALPALLVLLLGLFFGSQRKEGPWLHKEDFQVWRWLIAGLGLVGFFLLVSKGLALFDEQKNLSLISIIANGEVPPRFFLNYPLNYVYHYGFHVFGASLMQLGGMFPWSAFDTAKAIFWGTSLLLAALLGRRYMGEKLGGWLLPAVLAFASGTRYLLFLLPPRILLRANELITLQGTSAFIGKPFSEALASGWTIDGGPPIDYIFGFLNGIMDPLVMAHQGPNTLSVMIFLLTWLLLTRLKQRWSFVLLAATFAMWALAWETTYALFVVGLFLFAAIHFWRWRNLEFKDLKPVLYAALLSFPIVLMQGGTLTEMARNLIFGVEGPGLLAATNQTQIVAAGLSASVLHLPAQAADFLGFSLRWPPAILSAHLGPLSLFSPVELLVALFELGPVILFTPWIGKWALRRSRAGDWPLAVFLISAWVGFLMPIFLAYKADRDISRLSWQAMLTWTLLLTLLIADKAFPWKSYLRKAAKASLGFMIFGGMVVAGIQLSAASTTQLAHTFTELDSALSAQVWGRFSEEDKLFGPLGNTTIITGQLTGRLLGEAPSDTQWAELTNTPTLVGLLAEGYDYVLVDSRRWDDLSPASQAELEADCIEIFAEVWDNSGLNFRRILDLKNCYP
jgi:hypothetical protein